MGNAGSIEITTGSLSLTNGAEITASTFGEGNAGTVTVNAFDTISADGESSGGFASGIFSTVAETGTGDAGGINLTTGNLTLTKGGVINASTFGEGDAGTVKIEDIFHIVDKLGISLGRNYPGFI